MPKQLDERDSVAILKHYEIDVAEGHVRVGTAMAVSGGSSNGNQVITATIGDHSAQRICPVTDFLAEGLIDELGDSHLKSRPQLGRALAHLIVKLSRMQVESVLVAFSLSVLIEGDHYEVQPKTVAIEASHNTTIPHQLAPHAHDDRGNLHSERPSRR
jgi:hypothetical protein